MAAVASVAMTTAACGLRDGRQRLISDSPIAAVITLSDLVLPVVGTARGVALLLHEDGQVTRRDFPALYGSQVSYEYGCFTWRTADSHVQQCGSEVAEVAVDSPPDSTWFVADQVAEDGQKHWTIGDIGDVDDGGHQFSVTTTNRTQGQHQLVPHYLDAVGVCGDELYALVDPLAEGGPEVPRPLVRITDGGVEQVGAWQPTGPVLAVQGPAVCQGDSLIFLASHLEHDDKPPGVTSLEGLSGEGLRYDYLVLTWDLTQAGNGPIEPETTLMAMNEDEVPVGMDPTGQIVGVSGDMIFWATEEGLLWETSLSRGDTRLLVTTPETWQDTRWAMAGGRIFTVSMDDASTLLIHEVDLSTQQFRSLADGYDAADPSMGLKPWSLRLPLTPDGFAVADPVVFPE